MAEFDVGWERSADLDFWRLLRVFERLVDSFSASCVCLARLRGPRHHLHVEPGKKRAGAPNAIILAACFDGSCRGNLARAGSIYGRRPAKVSKVHRNGALYRLKGVYFSIRKNRSSGAARLVEHLYGSHGSIGDGTWRRRG